MAQSRGANGRFTTVSGANFEPKRVRKARRKAMVGQMERARGYVPNRVADLRAQAAERAEFYRNLRMMKTHRRLVARAMQRLAEDAYRLFQEVSRVEEWVSRRPDLDRADTRLLSEALDCARAAVVSSRVAADEWHAFSRRRMYFVKELAA